MGKTLNVTDLPFSVPTETRRTRAASASEWLLAEIYARTESTVYVNKLGALTVWFELYHISDHDEPYIDIQLTSMDRPKQPDIIRKGLVDVLDAHPTRRAYWHGMRTTKVYGRRAESPDESGIQESIDRLLDGGLDVPADELRSRLDDVRPLPWE